MADDGKTQLAIAALQDEAAVDMSRQSTHRTSYESARTSNHGRRTPLSSSGIGLGIAGTDSDGDDNQVHAPDAVELPSLPVVSPKPAAVLGMLHPQTSSTTVVMDTSGGKDLSKTGSGSAVLSAVSSHKTELTSDGKTVLSAADCYDQLGYRFPTWKKWWILSVIFLVQCSMNMNAGIYGSALEQFQEEWGVAAQTARLGQGLFLIAYAIGCELWAPFSEELGRKPVLQGSLFLVNVWAMACALTPNFYSLVIFRVLQGLSSAGGSVTLGIIADMFEPQNQGMAVAFIVFSSVGGSVIGPIVGAFQVRYLSWHWNFWLQLMFGGFVQLLQFFTPETKASVLMARIAKKKRAAGFPVYAPEELHSRKWEVIEILKIMARPFIMFATEPIVLCLSLLSGFSDALIFTFLESFGPIFTQWNFSTIALGLAFIPIFVGYVLGYLSFIPFIRRDERDLKRDPDNFQPEQKLYWLLYTVPLLAIGLFGFAWTSLGPASNPWIVPLIFSALIGIANYSIYFATIDYMVMSYGPYAASATGGNGFARDFLAGVATFYALPLYENLGGDKSFAWGSTTLGCLAVLVTIPVYLFYYFGASIRARSKFAQTLQADRKAIQAKVEGTA